MATNPSRRIAAAFLVLLTTQEFRPLHSIQKLPIKIQNKMSNFSSISEKTPDGQPVMSHLHLDENEKLENETRSDALTDINRATAEVNITLPAIFSDFVSNKLRTASVLDVNSSQDLNAKRGLTRKLKVRNDLAPSFQNHSSRMLNLSWGKQRTNSYSGTEPHSNTDRIYMDFNLSTWNDFESLEEHGGLNNTSSDDGKINWETGTQGEEFEALDLQFVEKKGGSRSFNMTPTVIEIENEENLVYTCAYKCGEEALLPCSCSALCVVYDTCCENFSQDCPHILQDARYEFGDLITSDKFCSVDSNFIISSCPRHVQTHNIEINEMQPNKSVKAEEILKDLSENVSFIRITVFESLTTSLAPAGPEETVEKKLKTAALRAPVTDASSGITYINKTVYDCHKHRDNNYFVWALKLNYVYTTPKSLEDLKDLEDLDEYGPFFNRAILSRHLCYGKVIRTCPATWQAKKGQESYETKCLEFFGLTTYRKGGFAKAWYHNRFCAYCNEGRDKTFTLRDQGGIILRENDLRMLMTINHAGRITLTVMYPPFFRTSSISWSKVSCKPTSGISGDKLQENLTSISVGQRSVCSAKCSGSGFTLRGDGYCKSLHVAKVAVSDDGLPPLCSAALHGLASFITCGIQSMVHTMPHAEFRHTTASIQIDSKTQNTLYVVKIDVNLTLPYDSFFSTRNEESIINWRHLEVMAKSLKRYRLSNDLCGPSDTKNFRFDQKQVTPISLEQIVSVSWEMSQAFEQLKESLGPALNTNTTTTFCMSPLSAPKSYEEAIFVCRETFDYAPDAKAVAEFLDSPCFSHLDDVQLAKSGGSMDILKVKGRNLQTHWFLALGLGVLMVKRPHL